MRAPRVGLLLVCFALGLACCLCALASADQYVAYSLKAAHEQVAANTDFRADKALFELGGITRPAGLLVDTASGDLMLVGLAEEGPPLTLDDLSLALRARFIYGKDPDVRYRPPLKEGAPASVKLRGGVEGTPFGEALTAGGAWLAKRAQAEQDPPVVLWLYVTLPDIQANEGAVALGALDSITCALPSAQDGSSAPSRLDVALGNRITSDFVTAQAQNEPLARLEGLAGLVGLGAGLELLPLSELSDLAWWLSSYPLDLPPPVFPLVTPDTPPESDMLRAGLCLASFASVSNSAEALAPAEPVLAARPDSSALRWTFEYSDWGTRADQSPDLGKLAAQALFLAGEGQSGPAVSLLDDYLALRPESATAAYQYPSQLFGLGQLELAASKTDELVRMTPFWGKAKTLQASFQIMLGEPEAALPLCEAALELNPVLAEAMARKGIAYRDLNDAESALEPLTTSLQLDPTSSIAWDALAAVLASLGRLPEAADAGRKAVSLEPDSSINWYNLGLTLSDQTKYSEAVRHYEKAVELDPELGFAWNNLGMCLDQLGRSEEALVALDRALALDPYIVAAWHNKGLAFFHLGRVEESLAFYDRALELNPDHGDALTNKGVALLALQRNQEALSYLSKAVQLDPENVTAWANGAVALLALGQPAQALSCVDKALEIDPDELTALTSKGLALAALGRTDEARAALQRAVDLGDDRARDLLNQLGG